MRYAKIEDGKVVATELPSIGSLPDGRMVSGFDKLPGDILSEMGWLPIEDVTLPDYDPETETISHSFDVKEDRVDVSYEVIPLPEPQVDPIVESEELPVIEQLEALTDLLFSKGVLTISEIASTKTNKPVPKSPTK